MTIRHFMTRSKISLQGQYPSIGFGVGLGSMLGATFLACRATLKLEKVLDETIKDLESVKTLQAVAENSSISNYTSYDSRRDHARVYGRAALKLIKLYGPSVLVGAVGIGFLGKSHTTLLRRNRDLALAYAALDRAYQAYRERFHDEVSEDYVRSTEIDEALNQLAESPDRPAAHFYSPYARIFDEASAMWSPNPLQNRTYIEVTQTWANNTLKRDGVLYLNDIYKQLGFDIMPGGQLVGWIWDHENRVEIDFDLWNPRNQRFHHGWEQNVILDFNVQGLVMHLLKERDERKKLR